MSIERYSVGLDSAASVNSGAAYAEMIAGAERPISVRAISITTSSNVGGHVRLARAYAVGTATAAGIFTGVAHRTLGGTAVARAHAAWSQAPTGYLSSLREELLPLATGQMRELWREEDGPLVLEPGTSLLLLNQGSGIAGGGLHINFTWEEGTR